MKRGERMKQSMVRGDGALIDVLARLRELQSLPWACFASSIHGRRELAALATLVGAGLMGAIVFVRGISLWSSRRSLPAPGELELELTVPGLQNWGNNCFLNAILQALASSHKFAAYLRAYELQGGGDESQPRMPSMPLSAALCDLLQELAEVAPGRRIVSPRHVMRVLSHYARSFDLAVQQDAAEALSYLATAVQKERMEDFEEMKPTLQSLADVSASRKGVISDGSDSYHDVALQCWRQQLRWPMEGTYGSLLACSQCGFQAAVQFQFFRDLSLALPCTPDGQIKFGCTIEDCLTKFTMLERVSSFRCNRCAHLAAACYLNHISGNNKDLLKKVQSCNFDDDCSCESLLKERDGFWFRIQGDAYKCLQIGRCPEVLCLHLQRVMVNSFGQLEKLSGHVSFSTELDLYPFTVSSQQSLRSKLSTGYKLRSSPASFDASATIKCSGGAESGDFFVERFGDSPDPMECTSGQFHSLDEAAGVFSPNTAARCIGGADVPGPLLDHFCGFAECRSWVEPQEPEEAEMHDAEGVLSSSTVEEADAMEECDCSPNVPEAVPQDEQAVRDSEAFPSNEKLHRQMYDLISVVVHHGGPISGHYTVYRKVKLPRFSSATAAGKSQEQICGGEEETMWFEISDTHVVKVSEKEVLAARASLLFYELH